MGNLTRRLSTLCQIHTLSFQDMKKSLRTLENLHICCLCLLNGLVVLVSGLLLSRETLVQFLQSVSQNTKILLNLCFFLLLLQNLSIDLLTFLTKILNTFYQLVVVVLKCLSLSERERRRFIFRFDFFFEIEVFPSQDR